MPDEREGLICGHDFGQNVRDAFRSEMSSSIRLIAQIFGQPWLGSSMLFLATMKLVQPTMNTECISPSLLR